MCRKVHLLVHIKGGEKMASLRLDKEEMKQINTVLAELENKFGAEYVFVPETSCYSCKCSGPAQSCAWH